MSLSTFQQIASNSSQILSVQGQTINLKRIEEEDFLCLTDMVRNYKRPDDIIRNWLRTRNTLNFLGEWEKLYNPNFKPVEFDGLMRYAGDNSFTISVKEWKETTNAIGVFSKKGRNGGTYGHRDIAFKFGGIGK